MNRHLQVDVSNKGRVWGVNKQQHIFKRSGNKWKRIGGAAVQVSVGKSGVWVVNSGDNIYYRTGTFNDRNTAGRGVSNNLCYCRNNKLHTHTHTHTNKYCEF